MAISNSTDEEIISGINITPLVDVVLVLLIIFLITAPAIYQSAIRVNLPQATTGERSQTPSFRFSISANGQVSWDSQPIDWDTLGQRLKGLDEKKRQETAYINADRETPHGTVIRLMDTLRQAGISHLAMSVESVREKNN